jgi:uncharacterized protein (TIGR02145 family)
MKKQSILILLFSIPFLGISQLYTPGAGVADVDGNTYQTVIINGHEWMAENLRTSKYANGDPIPNVIDNAQWSSLTTGAWAHYNNDSQYENIYGKLYNWYTTVDSRNLCPNGWKVPSEENWIVLLHSIDTNANVLEGWSNNIAGGKMKSTGIQFWQTPNLNATNESGFAGLPGGVSLGPDNNMNVVGYWWGTSDYNEGVAMYAALYYDQDFLDLNSGAKNIGISVRCLKNSTLDNGEIKLSPKTLINVFDIMGRETNIRPNEVLLYQYSDGSVEKKLIIEK